MLFSILLLQGFGDPVDATSDAIVLEHDQLLPVAFPVEEGLKDAPAGHARQSTNHLMELDIHLLQRLLHVLHMGGGIANQVIAMTPVGAQDTDVVLRSEGRGEQAKVGFAR